MEEFVPIFYCPILVGYVNYSLDFSVTHTHCVFRDAFLHTLVVMSVTEILYHSIWNHATFKYISFFPHSDVWFELQRVL